MMNNVVIFCISPSVLSILTLCSCANLLMFSNFTIKLKK